MWQKIFSVLSVFLFLVLHATCKDQNIVKIDGGLIKGDETAMGFEYRGIPYAKPPVGLLRFANPEQYSQTWEGIREHTVYGPSCAQYSHFGYQYVGEEDCLTLNVFVPRTVKEGDTKAPVIFFIGGGAFMYGGGNVYGPENFMNYQKMILVTSNYRLGVLGFLSTEDEVIPGNFGLKDQVEALKWVQRNIEAFNGDPKQVTITGFSAGGASVHLHYMSPLTDGLFNNGISHSANALNPWVFMEKAEQKAVELAKYFKCHEPEKDPDHESILKCLRTRKAEDLVVFAKHFEGYLYNPLAPFGVVVEQSGPTSYLTDSPKSLLEGNKVKDLPWIFSQVEHDGLYPAVEFVDHDKMEFINMKWLEIAPHLLDYSSLLADYEKQMDWSLKIKKEYFGDDEISLKNFYKFRQVRS
jgi:carboxylesterase type B